MRGSFSRTTTRFQKDIAMTTRFRSLLDSFADISTAVRASREYSRLSAESRSLVEPRKPVTAFLPQ